MTTPTDHAVIISRYGNRVVKWDAVALRATLTELRGERNRIAGRYETPDRGDAPTLQHTLNQLRGERESVGRQPNLRITDTDGQRLLSEAEWVKDNTNHILESGTAR
jgi:hypothetical protein